MLEILQKQLESKIDSSLVTELLNEYEETKKRFLKGDKEGVILHSAKFSEIVLAILIYINENQIVDINNIEFENFFNRVVGYTKTTAEDDLLYLEVPYVAKSIYTLRNKKRVGHVKKLDPLVQDSFFANSSIDWILASFIFLYSTQDEKEINFIIKSLIEKKIPFIEEFEDQGIAILKKVDYKWQVLIVLYHYNKFMSKKEIKKLSRPKYSQLLDTSLRDLLKQNYIYFGEAGFKITRLGLKKVETDFLKK